MEKYENIAVVGEGSYGLVMKCRHRESGQVVAIKKFIETEEDHAVRKMALREIRLLKKLRHDNLVNLIEVFRRKRRFYLVFEFMDHTVLEELEENVSGLGDETSRKYIFQVIRGIDFCHANNIVHRDVKPENVLVSRLGVVKLCDFGFARCLIFPGDNYTDYVATRWYRAPELLVGDPKYGRQVDIWAIGCLFAEMMTGEPLFPGDSDIDQLFQIVKLLGKLSNRHQPLIARNPDFKGLKQHFEDGIRALSKKFPSWPNITVDFLAACLKMDPLLRPCSGELLKHTYFVHDRFPDRFLPELRAKIEQEFKSNPLLQKNTSASVQESSSAIRHSRSERRPSDTEEKLSGIQPRKIYPTNLPRWKVNVSSSENDSRKFITDFSKPFPSTRRKLSEGNNMMDVAEEDTENKTEMISADVGLGMGGIFGGSGEDTNSQLQHQQHMLSSSPTPFQSLQVHHSTMQSSGDHSHLPVPAPPNSFHQVLHPSINNLSFNPKEAGVYGGRLMEPLKRSPLPLGNRLKEPVMNAPRAQMVRRLDRSLFLDVNQQGPLSGIVTESPSNDRWFGNRRFGGGNMNNNNNNVWKIPKQTNNDFCLPNVPGASASPSKGVKKKLNPMNPHSTMDPFISPKSRSSLLPPASLTTSRFKVQLLPLRLNCT
ncbi:cyclin-dependent kinase-like 2 [Anabrus simplex]|uniref:cyclin-dependent kinase-like 2 n=1 Tax=Anabrus simplex TaxID=316456 RepID=UPI0035A392B2